MLQQLATSPRWEIESRHKAPASCLAVEQQEERYLLSGSMDCSVSLFDLQDTTRSAESPPGRLSPILHTRRAGGMHTKKVSSVEWYPVDTGAFITSSLDGTVKLWDTNTFTCVSTVQCGEIAYVSRATLANGSLTIAVGTESKAVMLCDPRMAVAAHELCGHHASILSLHWFPSSGHQVVSGSMDRGVRVWDIRKAGGGACLLALDMHRERAVAAPFSSSCAHNGPVSSVAVTPDGLHIVSSSGADRIRMWDSQTGRQDPRHFTQCRNESSHSTVPLPIAACGVLFYPNYPTPEIVAYDLTSTRAAEPVAVLRGHMDSVTSCALRETALQLISASNDGMLLLWDLPGATGGGGNGELPAAAWEDEAAGDALRAGAVANPRPRRRRRHNEHS
jgi:DNA excision repair protein ERCC-8